VTPAGAPWPALRLVGAVAGGATLLAVVAAGVVAALSGYAGIAPAGSVDEMCTLQVSAPPVRRDPGKPHALCSRQAEFRDGGILAAGEQLAIACARHRHFSVSLKRDDPDSRRVLREEEGEMKKSFATLRDFAGPALFPDIVQQVVLLALTLVVILGVARAAGKQLREAVPGADHADLRLPFARGVAVNLVGGVLVTIVESVDAHKTGFDWSSYCVSLPSFWIGHFWLVGMSLVSAVPFAIGWHGSHQCLRPMPNPEAYQWGVGKYVTLLETWTFLTVVIVAGVAALWLHTLVGAASRTNLIIALTGLGALIGAGLLVERFVRNARELQAECERIIARDGEAGRKYEKAPTEEMFGRRWWQLPSVFVIAGGIAYKMIELAGVSSLVSNGGP
jgi:hypothetical protein